MLRCGYGLEVGVVCLPVSMLEELRPDLSGGVGMNGHVVIGG